MKWQKDWRKILKTYSFIGLLGNLLIAISVTGLMVLGVLSSNIAFPVLLTSSLVLGIIGLVGRFIDQEVEDARDE